MSGTTHQGDVGQGAASTLYPSTSNPSASYIATQEPSTAVIIPGNAHTGSGASQKLSQINDYCLLNLLLTFMCCVPVGIVALLKSNECRRAKDRADIEQAERLSWQAKHWGITTVIAGLSFLIPYVVIVILLVLYVL